MSIPAMIIGGRDFVDATLIDLAVITRPSDGEPLIDPDTFVLTPAAPTLVYNGRCRVKAPTQAEMVEVFGEAQVTVQRRIVRLPFDSPEIQIGDIFEATQSLDAEVLLTSMRVVAVIARSVLIYRDLGVEVVSD